MLARPSFVRQLFGNALTMSFGCKIDLFGLTVNCLTTVFTTHLTVCSTIICLFFDNWFDRKFDHFGPTGWPARPIPLARLPRHLERVRIDKFTHLFNPPAGIYSLIHPDPGIACAADALQSLASTL
jgi:hypothetical protein